MAVYTTIDNPAVNFNTVLYTGNGTDDTTISGVGFQSDLTWIKARSNTAWHQVTDSVRGAGKVISTNSDGAESDFSSLKSWNSDGFVLSDNSNFNGNTVTFVSWNWKESATAGFDIVTYTGSGSAQNISHSLSAVPEFFPTKRRSGTNQWRTYHVGASDSATDYANFDTTDAFSDSATIFNDTMPTSSVFTVSTDSGINGSSETYVTYLWRSVQGFSKFGTYTGNGNTDGPFVYTGFRPAFLIIKKSSASGSSWMIFDTKRNPTNDGATLRLPVGGTDSESTDHILDNSLSNGFKIRDSDATLNTSGATFVYIAFAEAPFVNSNGVPCNAR